MISSVSGKAMRGGAAFMAAALALCIAGARADVTATGAKESDVSEAGLTQHVYSFDEAYSDGGTPSGTFTVTGAVKAWVLAVGGGGSGANPYGTNSSNGGAGGGGAGGMVETNEFFFSEGLYNIFVGAGGKAITGVKSATSGENGNASFIVFDGGASGVITNLCAFGGGGGGIRAAGKPGGSGGGGSLNGSAANDGGGATQPGSAWGGWGYPGGKGLHTQSGAGGGGAGTNGWDTAEANAGAPGGEGRISRITGFDVWYAGGGGGGSRTGTVAAAGGQGGGGAGATSSSEAAQGTANTGGGGGGGSYTTAYRTGAAGGSGIVVIRILAERAAPFVKPAAEYAAIEADGNEHQPYDIDFTYMDVEGDWKASAVGKYEFTVTLKPGLRWQDGTTGPVTSKWELGQKPLKIDTFSLEGWQADEKPNAPIATSSSHPVLDSSWYYYIVSGTGLSGNQVVNPSDWTAWAAELSGGSYTIRLVVKESDQYTFSGEDTWTNASAGEGGKIPSCGTVNFRVWTWEETMGEVWFPEYLGYHILVTVTNGPAKAAALENFPMLVRMNSFSALKYAREDRSDIRFTDPEDQDVQYAYEIEKWDPSGETLIWVKMPSYYEGARAVMSWGVLAQVDEEGKTLTDEDGNILEVEIPDAPAAASVWDEYAGVWHLGDGADSTAHAQNGSLGTAASHTGAMFGNGVGATSNGNALMKIPQSDAMKALPPGEFTVSFWANIDGTFSVNQWPIFFTTMTEHNKGTGYAARLAARQDAIATSAEVGLRVYFSNQGNVINWKDGRLKANVWQFHQVVYNAGSVKWFIDGAEIEMTSSGKQAVVGSDYLAIGGWVTATDGALVGIMDEVRMRAGGTSAEWAAAEYAQGKGASSVSGLYTTPGSKFVNRWTEPPSVTLDEFYAGDAAAAVNSFSSLYGDASYVIKDDAGNVVKDDDGNPETDLTKLEPGTYVMEFTVPEGDEATGAEGGTRKWTPLAVEVFVSVKRDMTVRRLGEGALLAGRVLLVNDDTNPTQPVTGQNYGNEEPSTTFSTYWTHGSDTVSSVLWPYLRPGSTNTLMSTEALDQYYGNTLLWTLADVRIGNTFSEGDGANISKKNFLPFSETAVPLTNTTAGVTLGAHMVMRNVAGAAICSPCYRDGIGTIYFDAVNGMWDDKAAADSYSIAVEITTDVDAEDGETLPGAVWAPAELTVMEIANGSVAKTYTTNTLAMAFAPDGTANRFYRVIMNDEKLHNLRVPCRFRIVRKGIVKDKDSDTNFILIDNIEASYPAMRADLLPLGNKGASGWGGAFEPAFPAVKSPAIYGRMDVVNSTNTMADVEENANFVLTATMCYRWRYLSQGFLPDGGDWKEVPLLRGGRPFFRSQTPLDVPRIEGDLEFWTRITQSAPYYMYCDYSGTGAGTGGYSERIDAVTNHYPSAEGVLPSSGTEWYVRLREGASAFEGFRVLTRRSEDDEDPKPLECALADDYTWRGFLKTPTNMTGTVQFRIEGVNRQTDGSKDWQSNTVYYAISSSSAEGAGILNRSFDEIKPTVSPESGESTIELQWTDLPIDAATGYVAFQIDERSRSLAVIHADYQNFNEWTDAKSPDGEELFLASTNEVIGTAASKQTFTENFTTWNTMPATNTLWSESFTTTTSVDMNFFSVGVTPNGWTAKYSKLIYSSYSGGNDYALQMKGSGLGSIEYVTADSAVQPRGIDTIKLKTRLASSIDTLNDAASYDASGSLAQTNYTFASSVRAMNVAGSTDSVHGSAATSLFAYYKQDTGAYEFRVVRSSGDGATLQLYKWVKSGSKVKCHLVGEATHGTAFRDSGLRGNYNNSTTQTNVWARMAISVDTYPTNTATSTTATHVMGVLSRYAPAARATNYGRGEESASGDDKKYYAVEFFDVGLEKYGKPLTKGTMAVASANCPAEFCDPRQYTSVLDFNGGNGPKTNSSYPGFIYHNSSFDVSFDSKAGPKTLLSKNPDEFGSYPDWITPSERFAPASYGSYRGLAAVAPAQTLGVYLAPAGKTTFTNLVSTVAVNSFAYTQTNVVLRTSEDSAVQLRVVDEENPSEVILDDIAISQWRGADWKDLGTDVITQKPGIDTDYYSYTNYTFTTCWVTNHTVLMSARRTAADSVCSIVTPLMDGWTYGKGDSKYTAGKGLGMIAYEYENADTNAIVVVERLLTPEQRGNAYTHAWDDSDVWVPVATNSFEGLTESERAHGWRSCYIGEHATNGIMRIRIPQDLVKAVANVSDETAFGRIYISQIVSRDEPAVDDHSWVGWNLRTVGGDTSDSERRMYIADTNPPGLSYALNNSIAEDINEDEEDSYKAHPPFLQTPFFGTNAVGSVSFKARLYDTASGEATLALYGQIDGSGTEDSTWQWLKDFTVSTNYYARYTYTTSSHENYAAFRLALRGVDGVVDGAKYKGAPEFTGAAARVLLDEVAVTEAVRPRVGFRNVGAFRSRLNEVYIVPDVPSEAEQPLCGEAWGVQCEIYKAQIPDKIDFEKDPPTVILHWTYDTNTWGWVNWESTSHGSAELMRAVDTNETESVSYVYRSSYMKGSNTVLPMSKKPGTVVQFMLEVRYKQLNDQGVDQPATDYLTLGDWQKPEWYRGIDLNAERGSATEYSAYTILDTVAPHWAWINEVNIMGAYDSGVNSDTRCQFIEIAAPRDADLTGWSIRMYDRVNDKVRGFTAATFGQDGLPGKKTTPHAYGMSFRVIGSPDSRKTEGGDLDADAAEIDGVWTTDNECTTYGLGVISAISPIAVQLVRPTGILEHEIVAIGTNYYSRWETDFAKTFYPEARAAWLNEQLADSDFIHIGDDDNFSIPDNIISNSLSVVTNVGGSYASWKAEEYSCWTNGVVRTPGRVNAGQVIVGTPPAAGGEGRMIFANVAGDRIWQWDPDAEPDENGECWTKSEVPLYVQKNHSTNIVYKVDPWHTVAGEWNIAETETKQKLTVKKGDGDNIWYASVGTNVEENIEVAAAATPLDDIENYIGENNLYRDAIIDWLVQGKGLKGDDWPDSGEIYLAEYRTRKAKGSGYVYTKNGDLTLTDMYWLDIPPTVSNMWLVDETWYWGVGKAKRMDMHYAGETLFNNLIGYTLYITNANDDSDYTVDGARGWSPYVLRGKQPDSSSWTVGPRDWDGPTFKLMAKKLNSFTILDSSAYWLKVSAYLFRQTSFDAAHRTLIEFDDVNSEWSPLYWEWLDFEGVPLFRWMLDDKTDSGDLKYLSPTNTYGDVTL